MFMAVVGEPAKPLPRSWNNGSVALMSNGAIAVERPWLLRGRVRVDGRSFARLSGLHVFADRLAVMESEVGTAVAFFGSEWANQDRTGFMMIIGDSGVGLRLESEPQDWWPHGVVMTLRLDRASVLHVVELRDHVELSILACAGSSAVDGFACETPEQLTRRRSRFARQLGRRWFVAVRRGGARCMNSARLHAATLNRAARSFRRPRSEARA